MINSPTDEARKLILDPKFQAEIDGKPVAELLTLAIAASGRSLALMAAAAVRAQEGLPPLSPARN